MDGILELLLKNGAFGILAAMGFWLYLRERKEVAESTKHAQEHQIESMKAKLKLTHTLEDLAETVKAVGVNSKTDMGVCQGRVEALIVDVRNLLEQSRIDRAKEEGRREVTDRITLPHTGGEHEPR